MEHKNRDPMTDRCLDCGASREAIDDNLFPTCAKFEGPHRLALIAIHRAQAFSRSAMKWNERMAEEARQEARRNEDHAVYYSREADNCRAADNQLHASLEFLKTAGGMKEPALSVGEAIGRKVDGLWYLSLPEN